MIHRRCHAYRQVDAGELSEQYGTDALGQAPQIVRSLTMIVVTILSAGSRSAPVLSESCQDGWMPETEGRDVLALAVGLPRALERSGTTRLVHRIGTEHRVVMDREHPSLLAISWRCGPWRR